MVALQFLIPAILLAPTALAGRIRYEVRMQRPDWSRTTRSATLSMPNQHLNLIEENMRTWSDHRFRGAQSTRQPGLVIVANVNEIPYDIPAADAMIREMAVIVMCNVPGAAAGGGEAGGGADGGNAASIAAFNRRRDCKKRRGHV